MYVLKDIKDEEMICNFAIMKTLSGIGRSFTVEYEGKYQEVRNMGRADVGLRTRTGYVAQSSSRSCAHERHLHSSGNQDFSKASGSRGSRIVHLFKALCILNLLQKLFSIHTSFH